MTADDTVTAKLAEWETLVRNAPTGDYGLTYHTGTYEWQIVTDDKPTVQLMRAAITAMPALLGFVREVREGHEPLPPNAERETYCARCKNGRSGFWPCPTEQATRKWIGGEG